MFDIGFTELLVVGLVALIVLGPERLPKVARTAGHLIGRMQRYAATVKADIEREIQIEELKRLEAQIQEQARSFETELQREVAAVQQEITTAKRLVETDEAGSAPIAASAAHNRMETAGQPTPAALDQQQASAAKEAEQVASELPLPASAAKNMPEPLAVDSVKSSLNRELQR